MGASWPKYQIVWGILFYQPLLEYLHFNVTLWWWLKKRGIDINYAGTFEKNGNHMYACDIFTAMMSHRETGSVFFSRTHIREDTWATRVESSHTWKGRRLLALHFAINNDNIRLTEMCSSRFIWCETGFGVDCKLRCYVFSKYPVQKQTVYCQYRKLVVSWMIGKW